jgi:hypothetical protein
MLSLAYFETELYYTDPKETLVTDSRNSLEWKVLAGWRGNATFKVRAVDIAGNKSEYSLPFVLGKAPPNTPSVPTLTVKGTNVEVLWESVTRTSLPVAGYEIRESDTNWGFTGAIWKGYSTSALVSMIGKTTGSYSWYLRSYDTDGQYSETSRVFGYVVAKPPVTVIGTPVFQDTSLTNASVTLNWENVTPVFGLYGYEVTYDATVVVVKSNTITIPANWLGDKTVSIKTIDNLVTSTTSNMSDPVSRPITVRGPDPIPQASYKIQVIDNTVLLYWNLPAVTTLPISHVRIKRNGADWASAELVGDKSGTFTSFSELSEGEYTYRIAVVDTEDNESDPISITAQISQPPNFVFNAEYTSEFSGTKVNAVKDPNANSVVLPVNTTETWEEHFVSRGWDQPEDQVAAGYPYFIQPGATSATYTEIFDYGTALSSSQAVIGIGGTVIAGTPVISHTMYTSLDGVNYTTYPSNVNSIFATNFRFIKVVISVSQENSPGSIYRLDSMTLRLDSKQQTDSGKLIARSGIVGGIDHTAGTIVNFAKEFVDVLSITATANTTTPMVVVYDFLDSNITGTYSVVSNACTVVAAAHNLKVGQKVRLFFTSGAAPSGTYTVASVISADSYTVSLVSGNTSGELTTYPNSMRAYVYNTDGVRQDNVQISWAIQGY